MSAPTIEKIKDAIDQLPAKDQASLSVWLGLKTADNWERQMQRDLSPGGKGAKFVSRVKSEMAEAKRKGTVESLEKGLAQRRKRS